VGQLSISSADPFSTVGNSSGSIAFVKPKGQQGHSIIAVQRKAEVEKMGNNDVCEVREPGDTAFLLSSAVLVLTMQGGFALLESGSVRMNNSVNILIKNIFDLVLGTYAFWTFGWGLAYGQSAGGFIGVTDFFADNRLDYASFVFQVSFAATAATIDSGACAERMFLSVYFGISFFLTLFTYPVVVHWVWNSEGWLFKLGYVDLAGVSVVHVLGGSSALICALALGPRIGKLGQPIPEELFPVRKQLETSHESFKGEAIHILFGTLLLFFGWIGFNSGSALQLSSGGHLLAAHVAFNTLLGGSAGCIFGTAYGVWADEKRNMTPSDVASSFLAGLVGVTGAAHVVGATGATFGGAIAGIIAVATSPLMEKLRVDDPVGVLPVHFFAGLWGTLVPAFFAVQKDCIGIDVTPGLFYGGSIRYLGIQVLGLLVIVIWSSFWTVAYFAVLKLFKIKIRVTPLHEMIGNDVIEHNVDIFKRAKHTHQMHKMMGRLNAEEVNNLVTSVFESTRDGGNPSKIHPAPEESRKARPLKKATSDGRSVLALAANNSEAFAFVSANLGDGDEDSEANEGMTQIALPDEAESSESKREENEEEEKTKEQEIHEDEK